MHNKQNSPLWNMRVIALTMSFLVVLFVYLVWDVMARPSLREATDHLLEQVVAWWWYHHPTLLF